MLCERCNQKNATLYVSEYKDGQTKKRYLCRECANLQNNVMEMFQPLFENFLIGLFNAPQEAAIPQLRCPNCQMTGSEFRENGRFGCHLCYGAFQEILENALNKIQPSGEHVGKVPQKVTLVTKDKQDVSNLRKQCKDDLNLAIKEERYEDAAKLRDQIKDLDKDVNKEGNKNE